ncbi:hypothetical protein HCN44_010953 [Aphidius gifuensis]|uniref:Uncharacterized protein n=1 Tax=Aphidius gifuensis TaxID=684658 RepID=A0A834Y5I1_APHGI|nr:hypothetical protein HCN44_010953 [Aphidius gifuensis]
MDMETCKLCDQSVKLNKANKPDSLITLGEKGVKSFTEKSLKLRDYMYKKWRESTKLNVHRSCWDQYKVKKVYASHRSIESTLSTLSTDTPSMSDDVFDMENDFSFKNNCFICGQIWTLESGHQVQRIFMHNKFLSIINSLNDIFDQKNRVNNVESLVEVEEKYHQKCYETLFTVAPDHDENYHQAFMKVCKHLEKHKGETVTYTTLKTIMGDYFFKTQALQKKLKTKYGDDFNCLSQRSKDSLYFYKRENLFQSCGDWVVDNKDLGEDQQSLILSTAAEI